MECQILKPGPVLRGNISGDMRRDRRSKDHRALLNWQHFRPGLVPVGIYIVHSTSIIHRYILFYGQSLGQSVRCKTVSLSNQGWLRSGTLRSRSAVDYDFMVDDPLRRSGSSATYFLGCALNRFLRIEKNGQETV